MKKHKNLYIILGVIAFLIVLSLSGRFLNKDSATSMIFFYGDTCPHCKDVEEYIVKNNVKAKLNFKELEVYNNRGNAALLTAKAKDCKLDTTNGVGVPFFFDGQNCYMGSLEIENFFASYTAPITPNN